VLELFTDLEEYIGEAIYSLAKQGTDQSMAETIRQFIITQAQIPLTHCNRARADSRPSNHPLFVSLCMQIAGNQSSLDSLALRAGAVLTAARDLQLLSMSWTPIGPHGLKAHHH